MIRADVSAKEQVHDGRDVRVVTGIAGFVVVPVVEFGAPSSHFSGPIGRRTLE